MAYEYDVHFIGIGGIGMSAIAKHYTASGMRVSGSDLVENAETKALAALGAKIFIGHNAGNVRAEKTIFTSAISSDNPELLQAREICREVLERKDALAEIFNRVDKGIAVSGIHGKTTTTALISHILFPRNPLCLIGGVSENYNTNYIKGESGICIAEACEYKRNFLSLKPEIGVVLNVCLDHTDYYKDIEDVIRAFNSFLAPSAYQVINADDINAAFLLEKYPDAITFGIERGRFNARSISRSEGKYSFDAYDGDALLCSVTLPIYGKHNIFNALCSIAVCTLLGIDGREIAQRIATFKGTKRRFTSHPCTFKLFEDYAHHPEEIRSLIETASQIPHNKLYIIFQPHTYTRTKNLLPLFASAFDGVDGLYIAEVYAAREPLLTGGTSIDLYNILRERNSIEDLRHFQNMKDLAAQIKLIAKQNDIVIVTGAGDIDKILPLLSGG